MAFAQSLAPGSDSLDRYVAASYPKNHTYRLRRPRVVPRGKLRRRARRVFRLLGRRYDSLLDLGCSKGYYVLRAATADHCGRALGIDVHEQDLNACRRVAGLLRLQDRARFERLYLKELAARIDDFGGPFQACLLLNVYHYLFYGSRRDRHSYANHQEIFRALARVCSGTLLLSAIVDFEGLPDHIRGRLDPSEQQVYTEDAILSAACAEFQVVRRTRLGRRKGWVLERRRG